VREAGRTCRIARCTARPPPGKNESGRPQICNLTPELGAVVGGWVGYERSEGLRCPPLCLLVDRLRGWTPTCHAAECKPPSRSCQAYSDYLLLYVPRSHEEADEASSVAKRRSKPTSELGQALIAVAEAAETTRQDEETLERSRAELRAAFLAAHEAGASAALLARTSGYSRQRISQILGERR
jgi:hypothetical protein